MDQHDLALDMALFRTLVSLARSRQRKGAVDHDPDAPSFSKARVQPIAHHASGPASQRRLPRDWPRFVRLGESERIDRKKAPRPASAFAGTVR